MQKVVSFLEQHVQWVAIALGAIYLLFMVWFYVLQAPVKTEVAAGEVHTPGSIDQFILERRINELEAKINNTRSQDIAVPDFSAQFEQQLAGGKAPEMTGPYVWSMPTTKLESIADDRPGTTPGTDDSRVVVLPELPAPLITDGGAGRSLVLEPNIRGTGARGGTVAATGNRGDAPVNRERDAAGTTARRGGNVRGVATEAQGEDKDWVTIFFRIPTAEVEAAYQKVNLKQDLWGTTILDVQLVRERQLADGSWGEETVIEDPQFLNIPEFPSATNKAQQAGYTDWAIKNVATVIQPGFYQVTKGDQWPPIALVNDEQIDEATKQKRLEQQRRRLEDRKRQQEQQRRIQQQRRPTNRRQPTGGGGGGGMPGFFQVRDRERPAGGAMPGGIFDPMMMPGMGGMPGDLPGMDPGFGAAGQRGRQVNPNFKAPSLPPGRFDPATEPNIEGWIHDLTVEPDNVYRYKIRYVVRNPLFEARGFVADPKLAEQFAIASPDSAWSKDIEIQPRSEFFVAGGIRPDGGTVRFDVFNWSRGGLNVESFEVGPGDLIGATTDNGDFSTGWTVVKLHRDVRTRETQIILVDDKGNIETRDYASDQNDATYQELKKQVAEAEAAARDPRASR